MSVITIRGSGDDTIEIDGDIKEEFHPSPRDGQDEGGLLAFSDGTVLSINYTYDGYWRINPIYHGSAIFDMMPGMDLNEDYSDIATLKGEIIWIVFGTRAALAHS